MLNKQILFLIGSVVVPTILSLIALIFWQRRIGLSQWIRTLGPEHEGKQGTPSMGGAAVILGQTLGLIGSCGWTPLTKVYCFALWGGGLLGGIDDLLKMLRVNQGMSARHKMLGLIVLTFLILGWPNSPGATLIPGYGFITLPIVVIVGLNLVAFTGTSNAVNLTDGLDGLLSCVLMSFWFVMLFLCQILTPLPVSWGWPIAELTVLCWVNLLSLGSFLIFNIHPALIFMGDCGALSLGASIAAIFCWLSSPLLMILLLSVPVIETLSVIAQTASFKLRRVRIFKMAPVHHHFELCGWSEPQIVSAFCGLNGVVGFLFIGSLWLWHLGNLG